MVPVAAHKSEAAVKPAFVDAPASPHFRSSVHAIQTGTHAQAQASLQAPGSVRVGDQNIVDVAKGDLKLDMLSKTSQAAANVASHAAAFAKGDKVWYLERGGDRTPATIVAVDRTLQPHAYSVSIAGNMRDTEAPRLLPCTGGACPALGKLGYQYMSQQHANTVTHIWADANWQRQLCVPGGAGHTMHISGHSVKDSAGGEAGQTHATLY